MASKIDAFADLLDTLDDEKIAEMADVKPATVAAYRRKLAGGDETDVDEEEAADEEPEPRPERKPKPVAPRPPHAVRVRKPTFIERPHKPTWRLRRFDVFTGEKAAYLWEHYRDHIEAIPTGDG